jgi:hypothetical protein
MLCSRIPSFFKTPNRCALFSCLWVAIAVQPVDAQSEKSSKKAGEKFKNILVLSDMPADQMGKVMNMMSSSLGVNCGFCHDGTNFAAESHGMKDIGRKMLSMTLELNQRYFEGQPSINCNTCHRGERRPASTLALDQILPAVKPAPNLNLPSPEEIWTRYLAALGSKDRLASIKTRHVIAQRIEPNGKSEPEELWQTADGLSRMVTQYGSISVVEGFDGIEAWKHANNNTIDLKSDEAEQIQTEAILAFPSNATAHFFKSANAKSANAKLTRILDSDVYVVESSTQSKLSERLCFDVRSGLLVRRIASVPTVLGPFEYQVDYQDYKEFGGVLQPTQIRFAVPNITWTRKVQSVETDIPLDESFFRKPQ